MKPKAVVIGQGAWFVKAGEKDFNGYRRELNRILVGLVRISRQVRYYFIIEGGEYIHLIHHTTSVWNTHNND